MSACSHGPYLPNERSLAYVGARSLESRRDRQRRQVITFVGGLRLGDRIAPGAHRHRDPRRQLGRLTGDWVPLHTDAEYAA